MAEMTLNEAIEHAKEVAKTSCGDCAKEHGRLAGWLEELVAFKRIAPTPADVRPVVRGRWEWRHRHRGGFRRVTGEDDFGIRHTLTVDERYQIDEPYCPFCGRLNESVFLNFCPNCGADLRGGDAE